MSEYVSFLVLRQTCCQINVVNLKSKLIMAILHYESILAGRVDLDSLTVFYRNTAKNISWRNNTSKNERKHMV